MVASTVKLASSGMKRMLALTMAKKSKKSRKKKQEFTEEWEEPEKADKDSGDSKVSNNMLWGAFVAIFIAFIVLPFIFDSSPGDEELMTDSLNGITIKAPNNPIATVSNLKEAHIEGKRLEESEHAHNALNEIFVVLGQSQGSADSEYVLFAGLSDKTGITVNKDSVYIEGKDPADFWKAVWTFNSIVSGTKINSTVDLYDVQHLLQGKNDVYLIQDQDNTCANYGHIISAEGDILSPLGFKQAQYNYTLHHYGLKGGECKSFSENETNVTCPTESGDKFIITMERGPENLISIDENGIAFQYSDCTTVDEISTILRDMIYPNIVSVLSNVQLPTQL
jgi:hypothetical protein